MWTFIIAGTVYLLGVGVVLVIKPSYMFTPDGNWKEFGIGKRDDTYTPFPFWLFCLVWALISYFLILFLMSKTKRSYAVQEEVMDDIYNPVELPNAKPVTLPKGYYVLNKKATKLSGVPKYVYLGAEEPSE